MIRKKRMSKGIAKILSGLLVFGMVAGLVPAVPGGTVHAKAEDEHKHCVCGTGDLSVDGHSHTEETWKGISDLSEITESGYYYLTDDIEIESVWSCPNGVNLCLNGHSIVRRSEETDSQGGENAVINLSFDNHPSFVLTDCHVQDKVGTITHAEGKGEGVCNGGNFTMYNGKISNNKNGGVIDKWFFKMYGGIICNNTSTWGGGGVYVYDGGANGNFEMYGGEISGNNAKYGGGVYNIGKKVTMKGGIISNNTSTDNGGGVYNAGDTFEMSGGTISNNKATNKGGGVYNEGGEFTMSDGTISENNAMYGGGVYKESGTFTMSEGTIIGNTTAGTSANASGGGVYNNADAFTMSGGTITQNTSQYNGGGVYNYDGTFEMSGGTITGNETKRFGGGVYNVSTAPFNMSGTAEISNNKATTNVGGVFASTDSTITLSDAVKITGNTVGEIANNLYIVSPSNLQAESLTDGAKIGVTAYDSPTENSPVTVTNDATKAEYFISDNSKYETANNDNGQVVLQLKAEKTYTITASAGANGSISPSGSVEVKEGESQTFTITPDSGYEIDSLKVDGTEVENPSNTYTFTNVTSVHTIEVSFKEQTEDTTPTSYNLWISGTQVTSQNTSGTGWSYDAGTNTLTLTDYTYSGDVYVGNVGRDRAVIWCSDDLNINLAGNSKVDAKRGSDSHNGEIDCAIYVIGNLTINGSGSLNAGCTGGFNEYGIYAGKKLAINGGTIVATATLGNLAFSSTGLYAGGELTIGSANVTAKAGELVVDDSAYYNSYGIESKGSITIAPDAVINAEGKTAALNKKPEGYTGTIGLVFQQNNPTPNPNPEPEPTPSGYEIINGANSSWTQNTDGSLAIRGNGEVAKFQSVKVDGAVVDPANYTVTEGSTIITLNAAYLQTLSAGSHTFEIVWTDGSASTSFTVAANTPGGNNNNNNGNNGNNNGSSNTSNSQPTTVNTGNTDNSQPTTDSSAADTANADQSAVSPKTGEDFSVAFCTTLLMVSCAGLAGMFVRKKNNAR